MEKKSNWQKDLEKPLVELGWAGVKGAELESLSMTEIGMHGGTWDNNPTGWKHLACPMLTDVEYDQIAGHMVQLRI